MIDKLPEKSARVFFALWPSEAERRALAGWQSPLHQLCGGRAMRADTLHLTLVFLGDVVQHRLEPLKLAAQEVNGTPFDICFEMARYWGHNHVVFAAPAIMPAVLAQLVHELEQRLRKHRFRFEQRSYKPHITLLRHAKWNDAPLPAMPAVTWWAHDFVLLQSLQDEQGARYEVLARFPMSAA